MLVGVVGKPSVGKSTFFKAATLADVAIASYPFTTIKPNHSVGYVRVECAEKAFNTKCSPRYGYCLDGNRFVPIDMIDVAGLVPGAHEGKGMGNQFLNDLNQADVLIHVIDASGRTNEKGEAVNDYDPANDIRFLEEELDYWYLAVIKKGWDKFARTFAHGKKEIEKEIAKQLSAFNAKEDTIKETMKKLNLSAEIAGWSEKELFSFARELRIRTKPMVIAANKIDAPGAVAKYERLKKEFPGMTIMPCSADAEVALKEAAKKGLTDYIPGANGFTIKGEVNEKQKQALEFIKTRVLGQYGITGVQAILDYAVFSLLKYIPIFPGGVNKLEDREGRRLPDCFLMPPSSTALDFAYKLHTDFGKNFIRAIDVKTKMAVGKEHKLKSGDVVEIVSGR